MRYVRCHTLGPPKLWCLQKYASSEKLSQILVRDLRCKYHFQWVFSEEEVRRSENRRDRAADLICTYAGGSSQTAQNSERRGGEGYVWKTLICTGTCNMDGPNRIRVLIQSHTYLWCILDITIFHTLIRHFFPLSNF